MTLSCQKSKAASQQSLPTAPSHEHRTADAGFVRSTKFAAAFSTGGLNKPVPCSTKASVKTDQSSEAENCDSASQPGESVSAPPRTPIVDHIDPAVVNRFDTPSSRPCEFCRELDPQFPQRRPLDQMVAASRKANASAHLTEDGYVRHRMLELRRIASRAPLTAA